MKRIVITGPLQSGKSTLAAGLAAALRQQGASIAGIIAHGLWKQGLRDGFVIEDLSSGTRTPLAKRRHTPDPFTGASFSFSARGMAAGKAALDRTLCSGAAVIFVDEIGKLEVKGRGWASCLPPLLTLHGTIHIWVVREQLVEEVCHLWPVPDTRVIRADDPAAPEKLMAAAIEGES